MGVLGFPTLHDVLNSVNLTKLVVLGHLGYWECLQQASSSWITEAFLELHS